MRIARPFVALLLSVLPAVVIGCDDDDSEPRREITVTGGVENRSGQALPEDASLIVVWAVDDDSYVSGTGTIDTDGESYRLELDAPPPEAVWLGGAVAIGIIAAVTGEPPAEGEPIDETMEGLIGLVENHAIIYVADRDAIPADVLWWLSNMPDGYSLGIGVEHDDEFFEGFEPVGAGSADLIIDDVGDLHIVNWS